VADSLTKDTCFFGFAFNALITKQARTAKTFSTVMAPANERMPLLARLPFMTMFCQSS